MRTLFIQQDHVSPPGPVGAAFARRGYEVECLLVVPADRFADPAVSVRFPDPRDYDAIVAMGAPWSVYDTAAIGTWIDAELTFLRAAVAAEVPVLGICFGGQALASALGGSVVRADRPELGWTTLDSDRPDLIPAGPWFEWHVDRWERPPGATPLARTEVCEQAFLAGRSLAVQFHPELTPEMLAGWLANGGDRHARDLGGDPDQLVADTARQADAAAQRADALVETLLGLGVRPTVG